MRKCKNPDYALRYVMQCGCGDTAHRIPLPQRAQGWGEGALWCVGTLSMLLSDGSQGIVYNPYPLDTLSRGVAGVTQYIECLSTHSNPSDCTPPPAENVLLEVLVSQGVEPIAVWGRCKSNYGMSSWDIGAGALFGAMPVAALPPDVVSQAVSWATALSPEFLDCMQNRALLQLDYASCMRLFFSLTRQQTPNAYFLYAPASLANLKETVQEPPDACLVFSGLQSSASVGSPLHTLMTDCSLQEGVGRPTACDLNPLVWSGAQPQKMAAAAVHGTVPPPAATLRGEAALLYQAPLANLREAFAIFNRTFGAEAKSIDAALFSADGDFLHDFFDCVFIGPYTRLDTLACDAEGVLDCPYYARDEFGGASRNFTACYGDVMGGDHKLPFTCGSPSRRSIIKHFMRARVQDTLNTNVSALVLSQVQAIYTNYTAESSRGCLDAATGRCSLAACALRKGFTPCMDTSFEISAQDVSNFVVETILGELPAYYRETLISTIPWTAYFNASKPQPPLPAQWNTPEKAAAAAALSHFDPARPIVSYSAQEAYSMPTPEQARTDPVLDLMSSTWGICTALLGQRAMTLPIDPTTEVPLGVNLQQVRRGVFA